MKPILFAIEWAFLSLKADNIDSIKSQFFLFTNKVKE